MERSEPYPKATTPAPTRQARRRAYRPLYGAILACAVLYVVLSLVQGTFALGTVAP